MTTLSKPGQFTATFTNATECYYCSKVFGLVFNKRHHCRKCGNSICETHSDFYKGIRVCKLCERELTNPPPPPPPPPPPSNPQTPVPKRPIPEPEPEPEPEANNKPVIEKAKKLVKTLKLMSKRFTRSSDTCLKTFKTIVEQIRAAIRNENIDGGKLLCNQAILQKKMSKKYLLNQSIMDVLSIKVTNVIETHEKAANPAQMVQLAEILESLSDINNVKTMEDMVGIIQENFDDFGETFLNLQIQADLSMSDKEEGDNLMQKILAEESVKTTESVPNAPYQLNNTNLASTISNPTSNSNPTVSTSQGHIDVNELFRQRIDN